MPQSRRPSWRILPLAGRHGHPVRAQERLRGWQCSDFLFGDRQCEDLRVLLM
jgi:hypothetical protein